MPNVIGSPVDAFADAVMADHREAMAVADVVDSMRMTVALAAVVKAGVAGRHAEGEPLAADDAALARRSIDRLLATGPRIRQFAQVWAGTGHAVDAADVAAFDRALASLRECASQIDAVMAEHAEDPTLPSLDELKRQLAADPAATLAAAKANTVRLVGRPVL